ncbi:hypothetical protein O181_016730 [Austropuccinia psidii MF-1]|uniref:Uncharacterized protein n=1 Tax=Austropuccinia psidii MF-1 TaxID=1389203 RepID=A0A9Q3C6F9_9BASI|nr:hypothetical protein [Austropuccinia psidii MF-1]
MDNKRFNLAHWEELRESFQNVCFKEISFKDLMLITKGWNPTRKVRLLEERATRIRENQATIQAIEEQKSQTGPVLIASGSQGVHKLNSIVASHHSGTRRLVSKSHHSSRSQVVCRRRKGYKGKNKNSLNQRKRESDPMIQKLWPWLKKQTRARNSFKYF